MQVVWQNYVSTNCNSQILLPSLTKLEEGGVDWMVCKQSPPPIRTARDEVNGSCAQTLSSLRGGRGNFVILGEYYSDLVASKPVDVDLWATRR